MRFNKSGEIALLIFVFVYEKTPVLPNGCPWGRRSSCDGVTLTLCCLLRTKTARAGRRAPLRLDRIDDTRAPPYRRAHRRFITRSPRRWARRRRRAWRRAAHPPARPCCPGAPAGRSWPTSSRRRAPAPRGARSPSRGGARPCPRAAASPPGRSRA